VSKKNKNLIKRDNWFNDYHEIPQLGIKGKRDLNSRIAYYNQDDFKNSTVVDLGCNMGQMTFQAQAWGAKHVTGIEYDAHDLKLQRSGKEYYRLNYCLIFD